MEQRSKGRSRTQVGLRPHSLPSWMAPVAFIAGLVFVAVILLLVVVFPNPTVYQFNIFRTIIAAALAAVSMPFTGFITIRLNLPAKGYIVAGGAFAIAVIVYFFSPAVPGFPAPVTGKISIRVWDPHDGQRRGLRLIDPGAVPMKGGDQVRLEADVNQPSYLYVIWIGSNGRVHPVYPWINGDWTQRPQEEQRRTHLGLPDALDEGWPMGGPKGIETVALLVSCNPLPVTVNLHQLLPEQFPRAGAQYDPRMAVWLDNETLAVGDQERVPQFFDPQKINDPILQTQKILKDQLGNHFVFISSVSFANSGAAEPAPF